MKLLPICWMVGWLIAWTCIAAKKGQPLARAAIEALLLGPFVLLLNYARQARKK